MAPKPDLLDKRVATTAAQNHVTGAAKGSRVTAVTFVNSTGAAVSITAYRNGLVAGDTFWPSGDVSVPANGSLTVPCDITLGSGDTLGFSAGTGSAVTVFCDGLADDGT